MKNKMIANRHKKTSCIAQEVFKRLVVKNQVSKRNMPKMMNSVPNVNHILATNTKPATNKAIPANIEAIPNKILVVLRLVFPDFSLI